MAVLISTGKGAGVWTESSLRRRGNCLRFQGECGAFTSRQRNTLIQLDAANKAESRNRQRQGDRVM